MTKRVRQDIGRRTFLKNSTLMAVSMSLSLTGCGDESVYDKQNTCTTTDDILGPFYKPGAPFRENITVPGNNSALLFIKGKVFTNCETVLKDAVVEIWNADSAGQYDMSDAFGFRGQFKTGVDGSYHFTTIIPGRYLNGGTFRPSHIHFLISAANHETLVSQIYFRDDPFIDDDPWASAEKASERILMVEKDASGNDTVNFDIYLTPRF
jgi:catechol 1,2-dioxygenase